MKKIKKLFHKHQVLMVVSCGLLVYSVVAHIFKTLDVAPMVEVSYLLTEIVREVNEI